jgi:argininosuccinate lyase
MDGHFDNTLDAVSDRDFAIDALHAASLLLVHLSSLGEELVLWTTPEFGFVTLPPDLTTGSSLMPQKRNPDGAELLRSAATLVASDAQAALLIPRSLPLAYNRDLQDAKGPLLRGLPRAILATRVAEAMVAGAQFHPVRLAASLERGNLEATDAADALVRAGVPFREAHGRIAGLVAEAEAAGTTLASLGPAAWNRVGLAAAPPLRTDAKTTPGGPSPKLVRDAVSASRQKLSHFHQAWSARQHRVIEAEKKLEGIA